MGYFWASFDRLLAGIYTLTWQSYWPSWQSLQQWPSRCNPGGPVTVTPSNGMPTHGPWPTLVPRYRWTSFILRLLSVTTMIRPTQSHTLIGMEMSRLLRRHEGLVRLIDEVYSNIGQHDCYSYTASTYSPPVIADTLTHCITRPTSCQLPLPPQVRWIP